MYSRGRGGGTIAGWNFGTKVGKKRKKLVKLRTGSKKRRPSALRIRNGKSGERKREGGWACDLPGARSADIRISESDTDIYSVQSNVSRWKFIHAVAHIHTRWVHRNFSTPSDAWKERPCHFRSSFSSIGDTVPVKQSRNLEFFLSLEKRIISGKIERQWTACSFGLMGNKGCEERGEIPSKVFSV